MRIALTGATGFLGRYLVRHFLAAGHSLRCWRRPQSDLSGFDDPQIEWTIGELRRPETMASLVAGCDAVVHAGLERHGGAFQSDRGDLCELAEANVIGTLRLIEAARTANVGRFVFISTCAVHDFILEDRALDEAHPTWAKSHYGAQKAAVENFVCSLGRGHGYNISALRPCGIFGVAHPPADSKWFDLVRRVVRGETIECRGGGKEVHAADVARAVGVLLEATGSQGQVYNCCDRYYSQWDVAQAARQASGSDSVINGASGGAKHQIVTAKLRGLGFAFSGRQLFEQTIAELVEHARSV